MRVYLKSIEERVWRAVVTGWQPPTENGELKSEINWTIVEIHAAETNSRALNAIFGAVNEQVHTLISQCDIAKDAWDILQTTYEGTNKVKESRMQMITTQFETLSMKNEETVTDFYERLMKIANDAHALGEPISNERLVKKTLRALPEKFAVQRIAIAESRDLRSLRLDELMGSLRAYETDMEARAPEKKIRTVALKGESAQADSDSDNEEIEILTREFKTFLKKKRLFGKKGNSSSNYHNQYEGRLRKTKLPVTENSTQDKEKRSQCYECEGYGHIRKECPNFLRKQKQSYITLWSDEELEKNEEDMEVGHVALVSVADKSETESVTDKSETESVTDKSETEPVTDKSETESVTTNGSESSDSDTEMNEETIANQYRALYQRWTKDLEVNSKLKNEKLDLVEKVKRLNLELTSMTQKLAEAEKRLENVTEANAETKRELTRLNKYLNMMNNGTNTLDQILNAQIHVGGKAGLGCDQQGNLLEQKFVPKIIFCAPEKLAKGRKMKDTRVCYFCSKEGHIQRKCPELLQNYRRVRTSTRHIINQQQSTYNAVRDQPAPTRRREPIMSRKYPSAPRRYPAPNMRNNWYRDRSASNYYVLRTDHRTALKNAAEARMLLKQECCTNRGLCVMEA